MPSTYSPDLRIELIANGEQSGTWGSTTNSNLGTLIEDAISGLASVSVISADQALTALNGSADQARCAAISLTTTTTANFNVYVPPVTKLYVVRNTTSYIATVYCSTVIGNTTAAGTGVAIPAGKSVLLRADGTNVVEQLDHVVGNLSIGGALTLGTALATSSGGTGLTSFTTNGAVYATSTSALATGTLPVASGGTGTTTSTGTGSVVLSASPALTGTPTAPTASAGTNNTQIATTAFVQQNGVPTGAVFWFAASTAPSGFLLCNGGALSTTTYAALFAIIGYTYGGSGGTFNLPDLRGEFIRGWDAGRGVDSGRVFGSSQSQSTEAHQHIMPISWNTGNGDMLLPNSFLYGTSGSIPRSYVNGSNTSQSTTSTAPLVSTQIATTSGETRPRNVALLPCIKI